MNLKTLTLVGGGGGVVLSWPACYGDFTLQSTTDPTESLNWHDVADIPTVVDDQFTVTLSATNRAEFFRLVNH
jgi:hypothetical protein